MVDSQIDPNAIQKRYLLLEINSFRPFLPFKMKDIIYGELFILWPIDIISSLSQCLNEVSHLTITTLFNKLLFFNVF